VPEKQIKAAASFYEYEEARNPRSAQHFAIIENAFDQLVGTWQVGRAQRRLFSLVRKHC
jgi:hypothetical protein